MDSIGVLVDKSYRICFNNIYHGMNMFFQEKKQSPYIVFEFGKECGRNWN
jgi:hypothetical protein